MASNLPGRAEELSALAGALVDGPSGGGIVVVISGEAGVGKTRLISEAVPTDTRVASISFPHGRFPSPGYGLRALARSGGIHAAELGRELAAVDEPSGWKRSLLFDLADDVLSGNAARVLVLDDFQWADDLTLSWVSRCIGVVEGGPARIVVALRDTPDALSATRLALAPVARRRRLVTLELQPLDMAGVRDMARGLGFDLGDSQTNTLHAHSAGLPLAIEDLLSSDRKPKVCDMSGISVLGVPEMPAVQAVVREEMASLEASPRSVLLVAALAPQPASESLLRSVSNLEGGDFDRALERATATGFIRRTGPSQISFRHELHRQSVASDAPEAERRMLHRQIAQALKSLSSAAADEIADHLIAAGDVYEAIDWLEQAAEEAARTHDHGSAFDRLNAALELLPRDDWDLRVSLLEKADFASRYAQQPVVGLRLIDEALKDTSAPSYVGRLLLAKSHICVDLGLHEKRVAALVQARKEFATAGDRTRESIALGQLALPLDSVVTNTERLLLGREGLRIAESEGDPLAIALCSGNLAGAEMSSGNAGSAFSLWAKAVSAVDPRDNRLAAKEYFRNYSNWVWGALDYGAYAEARRVIALVSQAPEAPPNPAWEKSLSVLEGITLWRTGHWNDSFERLGHPYDAPKPEVAIATALRTLTSYESAAPTDVTQLEAAAEALRDFGGSWEALAFALLVRVRHYRREPNPTRGATGVVERIVASGVVVGWDDVLPALALADRSAYRKTLSLLGGLRPVGPRARASLMLAQGLDAGEAGSGDADGLLVGAAKAYEELGEPYPWAQALEAAMAHRLRLGHKATDLAVSAAEIYEDLGARVSLHRLLKAAPRAMALERFRHASRGGSGSQSLSGREREVADLAGKAYTSRAIADSLRVSERTVEKHLERIKDKLGVTRKDELVRLLSEQ